MDEFDSFINRLNQSAIVLHFLDGSASLHEIFGPESVIESIELKDMIGDVRYMPVNTKVDYYALADKQHFEGLRVKGFIYTGYGVRPFDVLITYNSDDNKMIDEKMRDRTQAIEKLAVYARKKMTK